MKKSLFANRAGYYALVMIKYSTLVFISVCCLCSFSLAKATYGQKVLDNPLTLHLVGASLPEALNRIADKASVKFAYAEQVIDPSGLVNLNVRNERLGRVLELLLPAHHLTYIVIDNTIILKKRRTAASAVTGIKTGLPEVRPALNPLSSMIPAFVLQLTVSGSVKDETGNPVPGVSVTVKGSMTGTSTDEEGRFSLENVPGDAILVFSSLGMATQEVAVSSREAIDVTMQLDVTGLDEVVVVGYGTQKKSDITGSVARVNMEEMSGLPNYNLLQSIQGKVPGLSITSPDRPGETPGLNVRGTNSISAGNSPLIVVDGIIYNGSLSDFNANDIATVDILKDASAAAVYGSRAANGVLLITTKTGSTEKPQFNFSTYQGVQAPDRLIDVLDGPGYLQKVLDFREATGLEADPAKIDEYLTVVEAENRRNGLATDWMDHVIRTGTVSNYHLNVSGRTNNTSYYVSGTYFQNKGIVENDDFDRISLNMNLTNQITDWYSVSIKSLFTSQDFSGVAASLTNAYRQSPYGSFYDENGPGGYNLLPIGDPLGDHPLINTLIDNKELGNSLWGLVSSNLDVPFLPGLKWTLNASANQRSETFNQFTDNRLTSGSQVENGIGIRQETKNFDWTLDNILNYRNTFNKVHSVDMTFLYSRESRRLDSAGLRGNNFFTQSLGYNNLGLAQVQQIGSNYEDQNSVALMGRINYSYDDRYALTLTARRDGFSGFARNNKYATFPSVAFAWTATNEEFLSIPWLSYLKLRLSYGKNGNQAIGRYQSLARMGSDQYVFGGSPVTTVAVSSMANYDLTWETTTTANLGIDFSIFEQKIGGSLDIYSSDTEDILLRKALPESSGFDEIFTNVGQVHNHGVEFSLNTVNLRRENLTWESSFVFSLNRNRIDKLTGQDANGDGREDNDVGSGWF
ncbi:MAG TPA: SusC/RagA family TonB-linked outer membrane protein, partial [Anseongella sp.]|nr:SusC/RagA family TonB-linked outer membrane protein [Anseongella sp.]